MRLTKKEKEKTQTNCTLFFFFKVYSKGPFFLKNKYKYNDQKKKKFSSIKKKKKIAFSFNGLV